MLFSLDGKTAVVTGGSTGIGFEFTVIFAAQKAKVYSFDINAPDRVVDGVTFVQCDVSQEESVREAFRQVPGRVDILASNAGISAVGNLLQCSPEDFERTQRVNVIGTMLCAKVACERMASDGLGGVILNTASCASISPIRDRLAYATSKGAIITMTQSIATDMMDKGIRCNCICPGRVHTPFVDGFLKKNYPEKIEEMKQMLSEYMPIGRMAHPREIAYLALYLVSDEARFVTGSSFAIDGGISGTDHPKKYNLKNSTVHPAFRAKL
eukprot:GEMP01085535.1.p1 GENE.GEMP01085535.1~~GEMP01085535.1.p1  ORF type:complete len:268 (+),score=64.09 GEMP01085535.1:149-952(+)